MSNDVVSRKDVPFLSLENKILYFDHISPKQKFSANFRRDFKKFLLEKVLTMGMLKNFCSKKPQQWGCVPVNYP